MSPSFATAPCRWAILGAAGIAHKNWQAIRNAGNARLSANRSSRHRCRPLVARPPIGAVSGLLPGFPRAEAMRLLVNREAMSDTQAAREMRAACRKVGT